jgi:hypothetical protein
MKITAATIVRNEEVLIAKHIIHLASLADEVIVIVQPSTDCTLLFARDCAKRCYTPTRVIEHAPEKRGWEFSLKKICEEAKYDWIFPLTADETYCGEPLQKVAKLAKTKGQKAAAIPRWHSVGANPDEWFKIEQYRPEVRLFHKAALGDFDFALHRGLNQAFNSKAIAVPKEYCSILEYKAPSMHYKGQCFCADAGVLNELAQCEQVMKPADLRLGKMLWDRMSS